MEHSISSKNLQRLPRYHRVVLSMLGDGREFISSRELAEVLGVDESLVRRDFAAIGATGRPRIGYDLADLAKHLFGVLGYEDISKAVVVGAGHLGIAITNYSGFLRMGLHIIGLFDNSQNVISKLVGKRVVKNIRELPLFLKRRKPDVGIITVPPNAAQEVADIFVAGKIRGIWDFSGANLQVPNNILVYHEDLAADWSVLSHQLKNVT